MAPKFDPVMVTGAPTAPEVGFRLVMLGPVPPPAALNATIAPIEEACRFVQEAVDEYVPVAETMR